LWLSLFLTQKCNRACRYCDIGNIPFKNRKGFDSANFDDFIMQISENGFYEHIGFTGGEIGLLSKNILDHLFYHLYHKFITVNTNGTFIRRHLDRYTHFVDQIIYHPIEDISWPIKMKIKDDPRIIYQFPVHHYNLVYLEQFLDDNCDLKISLAPYDYKDIASEGFSLTEEDVSRFVDIVSKFSNVVNIKNILNLQSLSLKSVEGYRKLCAGNICLYPSIDFVNGQIRKCVCSHTRASSVPLTSENLDMLFKGALTFSRSALCDTCYHVLSYKDELLRKSICQTVKKL